MKRTRMDVERELGKALNNLNFILAGMLQAELDAMPKDNNSMPWFMEEFLNKGGKHGMGK